MRFQPGDAKVGKPGTGWNERTVQPRHAPVWIRTFGTWRRARITFWISTPGIPGWECLIETDQASGDTIWPGRYVYDHQTIRPRYGDDPP